MRFSLYSDDPRSRLAVDEGVKLIQDFIEAAKHWSLKYQDCGARDTAAQDAFAREVAKAFGFMLDDTGPTEAELQKTVTFDFSKAEHVSVRPGCLHSTLKMKHGCTFNHSVDGFEALLLALASAGVDLSTPQMRAAVHTAYEAICNQH